MPNDGIRRPTGPIEYQPVNMTREVRVDDRWTFVEPKIASKVRIVKPRASRGSFICRPVPGQDWSQPEGVFEPYIRPDLVTGASLFGSWIFGCNGVENFGVEYSSGVSFLTAEPGNSSPDWQNPYVKTFLMLKNECPETQLGNWKILMDRNLMKAKHLDVKIPPLFGGSTMLLFMKAFIYADNSAKETVYYPVDAPLGSRAEDPWQLVVLRGSAFNYMREELLRMNDDRELINKDPVSPDEGAFLYITCNDVDPVFRTLREWTKGFYVSTSRRLLINGGDQIQNLALTSEQRRKLLSESLPWVSGHDAGGDYCGFFRHQTHEEIMYLMAKQFPQGYEVFKRALQSRPELFTDRVMDAFNSIPEEERTNVNFVEYIAKRQAQMGNNRQSVNTVGLSTVQQSNQMSQGTYRNPEGMYRNTGVMQQSVQMPQMPQMPQRSQIPQAPHMPQMPQMPRTSNESLHGYGEMNMNHNVLQNASVNPGYQNSNDVSQHHERVQAPTMPAAPVFIAQPQQVNYQVDEPPFDSDSVRDNSTDSVSW